MSGSQQQHQQPQQQEQEQQQRYETNFINSIRSKATRDSYQFLFNKYKEFTKGIVLLDNTNTNTKLIESQIVDFLYPLKNKGLSEHSVRLYFCAIAHFYIMNDVLLNRKKIIKFINTDEKKKHKNQGYSTEQIHKIIDVCDERTKAIILIFASTGIRLSAVITLKIGDLKRIKLDDFELYEVTVYQGYRDEYTTFCTPECVNVIDSYLAYRKRCGEQLKDNAPLIREQFDTTDPFRVKHPKHLSINTIAKILRLKIIQAGLREVIHSCWQ